MPVMFPALASNLWAAYGLGASAGGRRTSDHRFPPSDVEPGVLMSPSTRASCARCVGGVGLRGVPAADLGEIVIVEILWFTSIGQSCSDQRLVDIESVVAGNVDRCLHRGCRGE